MQALQVVVIDVLGENEIEQAATEDQHPVETLAADGPDERLGEGIAPWPRGGGRVGPEKSPDNDCLRHLVEGRIRCSGPVPSARDSPASGPTRAGVPSHHAPLALQNRRNGRSDRRADALHETRRAQREGAHIVGAVVDPGHARRRGRSNRRTGACRGRHRRIAGPQRRGGQCPCCAPGRSERRVADDRRRRIGEYLLGRRRDALTRGGQAMARPMAGSLGDGPGTKVRTLSGPSPGLRSFGARERCSEVRRACAPWRPRSFRPRPRRTARERSCRDCRG